MKKTISLLLAMLLIAVTLVGCGTEGDVEEPETTEETVEEVEEETTDTPEEDAEEVTEEPAESTVLQQMEADLMEQLAPLPDTDTDAEIGILIYSLVNPFWANMKDRYEEAGEELGIDVEVMAVSQDDSTEQLEILDTMISKGYDAIIFSPMDGNNLIPGIVRANEAGIPVVNLGPGVNMEALEEQGGHLDARITVNFEDQGRLAVEDMVKDLNEGDKVAVITGKPGAAQSEGRINGAIEAFEDAGMDVVAVLPGNWDRNTAYELVTDLIQSEPDIKGIFSANDVMGLAAVEALEEASINDDVLVYGVDFTDEAKEAIEAGRYDGTITYSPSIYTQAAELLTLKVLQGHDVEESVYSPMVVVNKDNVDQFQDWK